MQTKNLKQLGEKLTTEIKGISPDQKYLCFKEFKRDEMKTLFHIARKLKLFKKDILPKEFSKLKLCDLKEICDTPLFSTKAAERVYVYILREIEPKNKLFKLKMLGSRG